MPISVIFVYIKANNSLQQKDAWDTKINDVDMVSASNTWTGQY